MAVDELDAVVCGASIAGCTAATFLGRAGARVAVVERRPDANAFKRVCTHLIQPSGMPTLKRLGLFERLLEAGAVRTRPEAHLPWGVILPAPGTSVPRGLQVRREVLDPMLRELAGSTRGVDLFLGERVDEVLIERGRVRGVVTARRDGSRRTIRARLTVGADGRESSVAELARRPGRVRPHRRSSFWAYYRGLTTGDGRVRLWFLDPDFAAFFPTDSGLTLATCMVPRQRAAEFKKDLERNFEAMLDGLPGAPPIRHAERVSKIIGKLDMPNTSRRASGRGIAFVGDAALASDPLNAVGCGWALESAEWLAEAVAPALAAGASLAAPLRRYRRRHRAALGLHHLVNSSYSTGRRFNPVERLVLSGSVLDERLAEKFEAYGGRLIQPTDYFSVRMLAMAAAAHVRTLLGQAPVERLSGS